MCKNWVQKERPVRDFICIYKKKILYTYGYSLTHTSYVTKLTDELTEVEGLAAARFPGQDNGLVLLVVHHVLVSAVCHSEYMRIVLAP